MDRKFIYVVIGGAVIAVILLIILIATSCNGEEPKTKELTFWSFSEEKKVFEKIISDFQQQKDIKINFVKKDSKDYLTESLNEIASGNGPDIWEIPNDWLPKYHNNLVTMPEGKIADSRNKKTDFEVYQDTFYPVASQDNIIQDKIYGMPLFIDTLGLYYNPSIFSEARKEYSRSHPNENISAISKIFSQGPKNWHEFAQISQIITQKSGQNITLSGAALGRADNVHSSVDILTLMMLQNGAQMVSEDQTNAQFHTAFNKFDGQSYPGTKALEFYTSFANSQSDNYSWNESMPESIRAFAESKAAMIIDYKNQQEEIALINSDLNYQIIDVPQVKETRNPINFASYNTFTVTKASKNSELAWDFIIFLTGQQNARYFTETKKTSAIKSDDETQPALTAQSWYKPDPQNSDEIFSSMIAEVNNGQNPQTAIEGAAAQITNLLKKLIIQP